MAGFNFSVKVEGADQISKALMFKSSKVADNAQIKMLKMAALMVESEAKQKAPIDKGVLRNSITNAIEGSEGNRFARVGTNIEYGVYQEYGTGVYGPKGTPITPKRGRFLVFKGKDGNMVFARSVAGSPKREFMKKGVTFLQANMSKVIALGKSIFESQLLG